MLEIDLIYTQYKKSQEISSNPKLLLVNDPNKWCKKFVLLFNREKVIDMCQNPAQPLDLKNLGLKPVALNKQGEKLLSQYPKFWILFVRLIADKLLSDDTKKSVRDHVMSSLKLNADHPDLALLRQEL